MLLLTFFAFLAGLATILAPCIWPVLPIILSSSVSHTSKTRPLGITLGVILSFSLFTLSISFLVKIFHLDPNIFRLFSVLVIGLLGLSLLIPKLAQILDILISKLSNIVTPGQNQGGGFIGGFVTGLSLGIVWSPCAGPILASIATLSATGHVTYEVVIITLAYAIGAGIPLFIFSYGSQALVSKAKALSPYTGTIQKVFGVIMILTAIAIYTNFDKTLSLKLLDIFPQFSATSNSFENNSIVTDELTKLKIVGGGANSLDNKGAAPDFIGITKWLNTDQPISIQDLRGKVVLVDFWTYTCINCIRTLPYTTSWYDKYKDQGFVVIGVHTPEFEFEKDTNNVLNAIKQYNIHYPVAQDNDYATWNNYSNQYWPAEYLIDAKGVVRETKFGEGNYDETERKIQNLLKEAGKQVEDSMVKVSDQTPNSRLSPETYLGSARAAYYFPTGSINNGTNNFQENSNIPLNSVSIGGDWTISPEQATTGQNAVLLYNFTADKVFLVLRPPAGQKTADIKVLIDGKAVDISNAGADIKNGIVIVDNDRLYNLIDLKGKPGQHLLRLEFETPGIQAFAFTFG